MNKVTHINQKKHNEYKEYLEYKKQCQEAYRAHMKDVYIQHIRSTFKVVK